MCGLLAILECVKHCTPKLQFPDTKFHLWVFRTLKVVNHQVENSEVSGI